MTYLGHASVATKGLPILTGFDGSPNPNSNKAKAS